MTAAERKMRNRAYLARRAERLAANRALQRWAHRNRIAEIAKKYTLLPKEEVTL